MRARQRRQSLPYRLGQVFWCPGRARAERHHGACEGEQVIHAVIHLLEEEMLPLLGPSALGNIPGDF